MTRRQPTRAVASDAAKWSCVSRVPLSPCLPILILRPLWPWKSESSVCPTSARAPSSTPSPRRGAGGELSVRDHRAQRRRRRRAGRAAGDHQPVHRDREDHPGRRCASSTSPASSAARARAKGWATSSSRTSARSTRSCTSSAASRTRDIMHVEGSVDPIRDIDTIDTELVLADLETVEQLARQGRAPRPQRRQGGDRPRRGAQEVPRRSSTRASPSAQLEFDAGRAEARSRASA